MRMHLGNSCNKCSVSRYGAVQLTASDPMIVNRVPDPSNADNIVCQNGICMDTSGNLVADPNAKPGLNADPGVGVWALVALAALGAIVFWNS